MATALANGFGLRIFALVCAVMAIGGAAAAGELDPSSGTPDRYQVFFGGPLGDDAAAPGGQWRSLNYETGPLSAYPSGYDAGAIGYSGPAGISYFTPRLAGVGLGVDLTGRLAESGRSDEAAQDGASGRKWRLGGSVGTSTIRLGAAFGDHPDPTCRDGAACATNDFWDIGLAWRFGSGALSAGYTASLRRTPGVETPETLGIFSVSAGYRIAPGLDVFGGVDWIELPAAEATEEQPRNTRFMLGTNLRF